MFIDVEAALAHRERMDRRSFVQLVGLAACAPRARGASAKGIRAVAFDLFTLFDPRGIDAAVGDPALAAAWKAKVFEYCWIRAAAGTYVPFDQLVRDTLPAPLRGDAGRLEAAWTSLTPWPDSAAVLDELRGAGLRLAPLANFAPSMIERLLGHAKLRGHFDHVISTDAARSYKPSPVAYELGERVFGLRRDEIVFAAFGGWDAAGASWFGYPTFWVNRLGVPPQPALHQTATGPDLVALASWLRARHGGREHGVSDQPGAL